MKENQFEPIRICNLRLEAAIFLVGVVGGVVAGLGYAVPRMVSAWLSSEAHPGYVDPSLMNWIVLVLSLIAGAISGAICGGGAYLGLMTVQRLCEAKFAPFLGIVVGSVFGAIPGGMIAASVFTISPILAVLFAGGLAALIFSSVYGLSSQQGRTSKQDIA